MKRLLFVFGLILMVGTAPLQANTLAKMLGESGLSPEDLEIMTGQATSLYTSRSVRVGDKAEWKNDSSGSTGSVEVLTIQGNCVTLGHEFATKRKNGKPQHLKMRRCKTADGSWQLQ